MLDQIIFVLWFFSPAGAANIIPVFAARLPLIKKYEYPLDSYLHFRKRRLLGNHKTVRGFVSGTVIAILVVVLQQYLYSHYQFVRVMVPLNYQSINPILLGLLLGGGALAGDCVKSFLKRQLSLSPGKGWFPFDQIDYIIGGILASSFYVRLTLGQYVLLFIIWFIIHIIFGLIGYFLHWKREPF
jgi:CDP-2,3-bis-(O-geranylgeranyl)-sn-glycerol synthase